MLLIRNDCDLETDSARLIYVHIELQQPDEAIQPLVAEGMTAVPVVSAGTETILLSLDKPSPPATEEPAAACDV